MIIAGSDILASDFVSASAGAGDNGKGVKLDASGKLDSSFLSFLSLPDSPASFSGESLKVLRVNSGETAVEFVVPSTNYNLVGSNNVEVSKVGNNANKDMSSVGSLTIPASSYIAIYAICRSFNATSVFQLGLKVNTTEIIPLTGIGSGLGNVGAMIYIMLAPRLAGYLRIGYLQIDSDAVARKIATLNADIPTADITSITIRMNTSMGGSTMIMDEMRVYELPV